MIETKLCKKPYTTKELSNIIISQLKDDGKFPENILDYFLFPARPEENIPIMNYEWDNAFTLKYGGNEGIYLTLNIKGLILDNKTETYATLGTAKTLKTDDEAMRTMGVFMADYICYLTRFINNNINEFTWTGYTIIVIDSEKERSVVETSTIERAKQLVQRYLSSHDSIKIQENATRKVVETFTREEVK